MSVKEEHMPLSWMFEPPLSLFVARCPPKTFLPALCKILLDEAAHDVIVEVGARAITYYLDVSSDCARRVVAQDGAVAALCSRLEMVDISSRCSRDLAEQCVKVCACAHSCAFV